MNKKKTQGLAGLSRTNTYKTIIRLISYDVKMTYNQAKKTKYDEVLKFGLLLLIKIGYYALLASIIWRFISHWHITISN